MYTTKDVEKGITIRIKGEYFTVVDFAHIKMGRGGAFVRLKLKNLRDGRILEKTVNAGTKIDIVRTTEIRKQFIYRDGNLYYFMDEKTYEQIPVEKEKLGSTLNYLKEGMVVSFVVADEELIEVKPPLFCEFKVIETEPPIKGARAAGGLKPAKLETGIIIQVPMFIREGDVVKIDTRVNKYVERVK
jgi:elongation factor P